MKRDLNLIRDLLLFYESDGVTTYPSADATDLYQHQMLMATEGLIDGGPEPTKMLMPPEWLPPERQSITRDDGEVIYLFPLTWAGHDFLATARDDQLWRKAIGVATGITFAAFKAYLQQLAHENLRNY